MTIHNEFYIYPVNFLAAQLSNPVPGTAGVQSLSVTIDQFSDFCLEEIAIDAAYGGPSTTRQDTQIPPFAVQITDSNGKTLIATSNVSGTIPAQGASEVAGDLGNTLILSAPMLFTKGQTITISLLNIFVDPNGFPTADVYVSLIGYRIVNIEEALC